MTALQEHVSVLPKTKDADLIQAWLRQLLDTVTAMRRSELKVDVELEGRFRVFVGGEESEKFLKEIQV